MTYDGTQGDRELDTFSSASGSASCSINSHATTSTSDELLTDFYSKFGYRRLPMDVFDIFLLLLRNDESAPPFKFLGDTFSRLPQGEFGYALDDLLRTESFNPDDLTIRCTLDILDRIYTKERTALDAREADYRSRSRWPLGAVPRLVVELVAEHLHSQRDALDDDLRTDEILNRMSHVHPSWTLIAQRCLRRLHRLNRVSPDPVVPSLFNPHIGPWVQHLTLDLIWYQNATYGAGPVLRGFVQRCPHLTQLNINGLLVIEGPNTPPPPGGSQSLRELLGRLTSLEHLRLYNGIAYHPNSLWDLCRAVRLPSLRKLELHGWVERGAPQEGEEPHDVGGGIPLDLEGKDEFPSLDMLTLDNVCYRDHESLTWLTRPHDDVHAFTLNIFFRRWDPTYVSCLRPAMHRVLRLLTDDAKPQILATLLREARNLQSFIIMPWDESNFVEHSFALPVTVRLFHCHFKRTWGERILAFAPDHKIEINRQLMGILESSPGVRNVVITISPGGSEESKECAERDTFFAQVQDHCISRNVALRVSVERPPCNENVFPR